MYKLKIPESWALIPLDDACDLITCGVAAKPEYVKIGIPFLSAKNVQDEKVFWEGYKYISKETHSKLSKHNMPRRGDILYTRVGSYGEAAIVDKDDEFSIFVSLTLIKPKPSILLNTFLKNWLNSDSVKALAKKSITGVGVGNLNVGAVRKFMAPLPPLSEQKRIVAKIESTQEKVKMIEANISKVEQLIEKYRESLLQKAFRGELVGQNSNDEPTAKFIERIRKERAKQHIGKKNKIDELLPVKREDIPFEIPKSWEWVRLGDLVSSIDSGWSPQCESYQRTGNEWGVLKISAVTWGFFDPNENKALPKKLKARPEHEVRDGDFILSRANTKELVGRGVIVHNTPPKLLLNDKLLRIKFVECIEPEFICLVNNSSLGRAHYEKVASGTSSSMRNVTRDDLKNMLLPIPPYSEQRSILEAIQKIDSGLSSFKKTSKLLNLKITDCKSSILNNSFTGQLVPQNPLEGTGHELIEKISANQSQSQEEKLVKNNFTTKKKRTNK